MKIAAVLALLLITAGAVSANELHVLVPKDLRGIVMEVANFYEKNNPGWKVKMRIGPSQELSKLIIGGTPSDVFILNDDKAIDELKQHQLTGDIKPFLADDLVVVAPINSKLQIDQPSKLVFPELKGVALFKEDDQLGKSSREYLTKIGILGSIQTKIGIQENTKALVKSLADGVTDWGILHQSDATDVPTLKVIYKIPQKDVAPHIYFLGSVSKSSQKEAIQKFMTTIQSTIIQKFFENAGFRIVK